MLPRYVKDSTCSSAVLSSSMGLLLTKYLHLKFYPNLWSWGRSFFLNHMLTTDVCLLCLNCVLQKFLARFCRYDASCLLTAKTSSSISCRQNFSKFNQVQHLFTSEPDFTWAVSAENTMKPSWNFSQSWDKKQSYVLNRKKKTKIDASWQRKAFRY